VTVLYRRITTREELARDQAKIGARPDGPGAWSVTDRHDERHEREGEDQLQPIAHDERTEK
jgi:hypothetical protein